jgi:hypothetical protein
MKKTILLYLLTSLLAVKTNAQSTDWTKDDRNNIYNDCMGYIGKYQNLTTEQKESMSICYLDEITKKYTKKDYQNKIDIEIKKIRETTLTLCSKNLGLELSETKKEEPKKEEPKKETTSSNPTKEMLTGHWKDKLFGTSEKVFKILIFTNEKFVYQSIKSKKDTFTATRIK